MKKLGRTKQIPPLFTYALIILLAISVYSLSGILAKYTSRDSVSDGARVAGFDIDHDASDKTKLLVNMGEADNYSDYPFSITNDSEVDVTFDLLISFPTYPAVQDWMVLQVVPMEGDVHSSGFVTGSVLASMQTQYGVSNYTISDIARVGAGETGKFCLRFTYTPSGDFQYFDYKDIIVSARVKQLD